MSVRGLFITLEGGEGAGKSTALIELTGMLAKSGVPFVETREPGGTVLGEKLRELLLDPASGRIEAMSELLMIFAARAQHLGEVITPALERGEWVVCDRFTDASYAYQGAGRALGAEAVGTLESLVQGSLRPDRTLLLDVPVDVGLARARDRGALDRFEQEEGVFFERVREAYRVQARRSPERYSVLDATQPVADVAARLRAEVAELIVKWRQRGGVGGA